jgi:protease IV
MTESSDLPGEVREHESQQSPPRQTAAVPPSPERPRRGIFWGFLGGCLLLFVLLTAASALVAIMADRQTPVWTLKGAVGVVSIEGEIRESREIVERLRQYGKDRKIRAIVVRIDSPGGAIVPSQEIHSAILELRRESEKPIVASMAGLAASGGYYIAAACDRIVANRGTVTGSIGVIAQWLNFEGVMEWARITPVTIKSGEMKDVGNPFRDLTDEEREYFELLLRQLHGQFIAAVVEGREGILDSEQVEALSDGRVFTGEQAHSLGLVDDLGTMWDAVDIAAEMAGLGEDPRVVWPRPYRPTLLDLFFGGRSDSVMNRLLPNSQRPVLLYRWY